MRARILRLFHPVGQGAFYTEHIFYNYEKFNVVYDCGSSTNKTIVESQIQKSFEKGETIHALFISHLHEDHINGIPFLIKYCHVKNIFFPLISDVNKLILLQELNEQKSSNDFTYQFISNPKNAINNLENNGRIKPKLIAVQEVSPDNSPSDNDDLFDLEDDSNSQANSEWQLFDQSILSGRKLTYSRLKDIWEYIPFNFEQNIQKEKLEKILYESGITVYNGQFMEGEVIIPPEEVITKKKRAFNEIIGKTYDKISGKRNGNSMTVYSGRLSRISSIYGSLDLRMDDERFFNGWIYNEIFYLDYSRRRFVNRYWSRGKNPGCLYTGDYDASTDTYFNALKTHYEKYWSTIGCFQVPHHGSAWNFNTGFIENDKVYIISAGTKNSYGHPDADVIQSIHIGGGHPFVITEDCSSYLAQTFYFYF
jgi:hypothetical protein